MAATTTYLMLVNEVLSRLNEVQLTSGTFASAVGFHDQAKRAVNAAIMELSTQDFEWPFHYASTTQVLVAGTQEYAFPTTAKALDWDTFYISKDAAIPINAKYLPYKDYDEYVRNYLPQNNNMTTSAQYGVPDFVYRPPNGTKFGVSPKPNAAYTVNYYYWTSPTALSAHGDLTLVPNDYFNVLVDGAMKYAYLFRENFEMANIAAKAFKDGIDAMRRIFIPQSVTMQSNMIVQTRGRSPFVFNY